MSQVSARILAQHAMRLQSELLAVTKERDELKQLLHKAHMRYEQFVRDGLKPLQAQVTELQRQSKPLQAPMTELHSQLEIMENNIEELRVTVAEQKEVHMKQLVSNSALDQPQLGEATAEHKVQDFEVKLALQRAASYAQFVKHQLVFSVVSGNDREPNDWSQFAHASLESVMDEDGDVNEARRALQVAIEKHWVKTTKTSLRALFQACRYIQKPGNVVARPLVFADTLNDTKLVLAAADDTSAAIVFQALMKYGKCLCGETQATAMMDFNDWIGETLHH